MIDILRRLLTACSIYPIYLKRSVWFFLITMLASAACKNKGDARILYKPHPIWAFRNESEEQLQPGCILTKLGVKKLRFRPNDNQQCLNTKDPLTKGKNNIIETDPTTTHLIFTPSFYGNITEERFPLTTKAGIKHKYRQKSGGMPVTFLNEWLALEDPTDAILILTMGIYGDLNISTELQKALKQAEKSGKIKSYEICRSSTAIKRHNYYVQQGKKVFTFIHTGY